MAEVEYPDAVISSADKFVNKSFLRKVAHIQDANPTLPDPIRPNPFTKYVLLLKLLLVTARSGEKKLWDLI